MTDKKIRRTVAEIEKLVAEAQKLIQGGMARTLAAEKVGINYPTLMRHSKKTSPGGKSTVKDLLQQLEAAIRAEVLEEIKAKLG